MKSAYLLAGLVVGAAMVGCAKQAPSANDVATILCQNKSELGIEVYANSSILSCGKYFKIEPREGLLDAPELLFDGNGKKIATCGGLLAAPQNDPQECNIPCKETGILLCSSK